MAEDGRPSETLADLSSRRDALRHMRRESQKRHIKVTEVAARIIATYGRGRE